MLMVTGPFKYNSVPLRRVNQRYVIATTTRVKLTGVPIPSELNDEFFRRQDLKTKKSADKIFAEEDKVIFLIVKNIICVSRTCSIVCVIEVHRFW